MNNYFVYIVQSEKNQSYYIGMTSNLKRRVYERNVGGTKTTKSNKPWKLVYYVKCDSRVAAREREIYLKSGACREYQKRILPR